MDENNFKNIQEYITQVLKQYIPSLNQTGGGGSGGNVGDIIIRPNDKQVEGLLYCNGAKFDKDAFPELFEYLGTDTLPDYRGVFLRGYGNRTHTQNNGSAVGNTTTYHSSGKFGVVQGDSSRNLHVEFSPPWEAEGAVAGAYDPSHSYLVGAITSEPGGNGWEISGSPVRRTGTYKYTIKSSRTIPTANEIRPVNTAVCYFIRAMHVSGGSSPGEWPGSLQMLLDMPVGIVAPWPLPASIIPEGWLLCDGAYINQGDYPDLYRLMHTTPDYRGVFLRGYGAKYHAQNNGTAVGWTGTTHNSGDLNTVQGDSIREISGNLEGNVVNSHSFENGVFLSVSQHPIAKHSPQDGNYRSSSHFTASRVTPVSSEIRPVNMAVNYIIKATA